MPPIPVAEPSAILASLRASWVNLHAAAQTRGGPPPGVTLTTPAQTPIADMALPVAVKDAMNAQQRLGLPIHWIKLIHSIDSRIVTAVDDGSPLPDDAHLVHVQVVTTSVSAAAIHVESHVLVGTTRAVTPLHPIVPGPVIPGGRR